MQQRNSTIGRPSGTDGSDYSYRMVVDSRYQLVARGKKRLSVLLPLQALFLLMAAIFAVLPGTKEDALNEVAVGSAVCGLITLIIAEFGRRRSRASFLGIYPVTSSIIMLLAVILARRHSLMKVLQDSRFWQTKKFDLNGFPVLQACLVVDVSALVVLQFLITKTIIPLMSNMSPPRKAKPS
ncbi:uncharacterized protein LOC114711741 [Neltuma alba]|uniref:uncharacterized protein LOC114711741 n=1 Tax=Neltuma alba TaxID=207710 RepID=UPI0010A37191|nr:uncharacterized protein LOC114711741 [Prosopis alba]